MLQPGLRVTEVCTCADDSLSNHSDDSGHRSFGVVLQREHHKRRRVDEEMQSPKDSDKHTCDSRHSQLSTQQCINRFCASNESCLL